MQTKAKKSTIMNKLLIDFSIIIVIMFVMSVYSLYGFKSFYTGFYSLIDVLVKDYTFSVQIDSLYQEVDNFTNSGNEEYLKSYRSEVEHLKSNLNNSKLQSTGDFYYKFRELYNMVVTFDEKSTAIIQEYDNGTPKIYIYQSKSELNRLRGYIQDELKELLNWKLSEIQEFQKSFYGKLKKGENLTYSIFIFITILCIFFAYRFSKSISVPIHKLVLKLDKIGKGDLDIEPIGYKSNNELGILFDSFTGMAIKIKNLIEDIKEKANLERKIKEQEIKNIEMVSLLSRSEVKFLQSQINPHFLFNTINTISVLADIEKAPRTKKVLEDMSNILRYNFKKLDDYVTLKEEYNIVKNYIHIQNIRFGDRIKFKLDVDRSLMNCIVPSMILQPFIENAVIHGLEPKLGKGLLELNIFGSDEQIHLIIRDNGLGIPESKIKNFFSYKEVLNQKSQKGIGVINVIRRLEIIYGKNVVEIYSRLGEGTEVRMTLKKTIKN
jgi:two-component system, sensor histidine kinase YesM